VLLNAADPRPLCELALRIIGSTLVASAIDVAAPVDGSARQTMAVRFEGIHEAVRDQADTLMQLAASLPLGGESSVLEGEQERRLWQTPGLGEGTTTGDRATLTVKASVLPGEVARWLVALRQMEGDLSASWRAHAGHGLIHAWLSGTDDMLVAAVAQLRAVATEGRGSLVVADAPPALAQRLDVWGPVAALDLMRHVKAQFDPRATLNPGRFVGGI
jgi:glycolate oxidase FAD binding subunit